MITTYTEFYKQTQKGQQVTVKWRHDNNDIVRQYIITELKPRVALLEDAGGGSGWLVMSDQQFKEKGFKIEI